MTFDWRLIPFVVLGGLFISTGIETYTPLEPTKPVLLSSFGWIKNSSATQHVATIECVADGAALALYVKNLQDLQLRKDSIPLFANAELTTLSRAKRLIHDRPASTDYDPGCIMGGYFEMKKSHLLWKLIGWD
jgi:hypothetical protein